MSIYTVKAVKDMFTLYITNNKVKIQEKMSKDQLAVLQDICSFEVEGSDYKSNALQKRSGYKWDGYRRLFDIQGQTFPIGLLNRVKNLFDTLGVEYKLESHRKDWSDGKMQYNISNFEARDYQRDAILSSILHGNGIVKAATGCFTGDTIIQVNASKRGKKQTIESLWCSWHGVIRKIGKYGTLGNTPIKNKDQIFVRGLQDNRVGLNKVLDVINKGFMFTIKLVFDDGTVIKCTPDHELYDADMCEWIPAEQFINRNIGKDTYINNFGQGIIQKTKCISIEDNGVQEVFDICCEKYHSYTANGLIVHNSGKTTIAARTIAAFDLRAIFVVHTRDLLYQTKESFGKMFPNEVIGQIGDGIIDYENITVATMQTLAILGDIKYQSYKYDEDGKSNEVKIEADKLRKEEFMKYRHTVAVVMFDEVQRICSQTAYGTRFLFNNARYAFGYSASPWRDDGSDLMIEAAFGSRIVDITASELIEQGYLVQPIIDIYQVNNSTWSGKTYVEVYKSAIVDNVMRNMQVIEHAIHWYTEHKNVLILVTQIQHGEALEKMLYYNGITNATFISGKSGMKKRKKVIQAMRDGEAPIVIASTIADVGLDVPRLDVIVEAGAGKSSVTALQRLGRIMRPFEGKETCRFVTFKDKALFLNTQVDKKIEIWQTEPKFIINEY